MSLTVGTAGHIDHGKTALVRALTGKDTDRLPEEQARGISIELGYAPLDLPDGRRLSLVDVPGHERFVRTMVAGATGIDLFLLVIDAGEGARPQTHEHLAILRLLGVERGVVAVTKADAVDEETLGLVMRGGTGARARCDRRRHEREDRAGAGRATGGARSGRRRRRARSCDGRNPAVRRSGLHPARHRHRGNRHALVGPHRSRRRAARRPGGTRRPRAQRARCTTARSNRRGGPTVAVSLPGIERTQLQRGDALVAPGAYPLSYRLDVALDELEPIGDGARIHVHHGTAETPAVVKRIGDRYAQLRLAAPAVAARGDRVVLRAETTIGGGTRDRSCSAPPQERSNGWSCSNTGTCPRRCTRRCVWRRCNTCCGGEPEGLERAGDWVFADAWLVECRADLESRLDAADPLDPGIPTPAEPWAVDVIARLGLERRGAKLYRPGAAGELGQKQAAADELTARLGLEPVKVDDGALARFLEEQGTLVRVGDGYAVSRTAFDDARIVLVEECRTSGQDHARAVPRPARGRPPHGATAARAVRRGRPDPSRR